uniref:hypothetical protein n=1 Tax=Roseovarius sp. TaxID=1486281 RepID=UPI00356A048D
FGGDPNIGAFLFGVAEAQRTATNRTVDSDGGDADAPTPGIGGGSIGGPTIIIPIGNLGPGGGADINVGGADNGDS